MKNIIIPFLKFLALVILITNASPVFSQAKIIFNNNPYLSMHDGIFLVIDNSNASSITTLGTGGNIVSEGENNKLRWDVGSSNDVYSIPFTTTPVSQGGSGTKIPLTVTVSGGTGSGVVDFSTYQTSNANTPLPTGVTNMNVSGGTASELDATDRFWIIDPNGYTSTPNTEMTFTYDDNENLGTNTIDEAGLKPHRFEAASNFWVENSNGMAVTVTNTVNSSSVSSSSSDNVWTLIANIDTLEITSSNVVDVSCNGQSNGSVSITTSGGLTPHSYLWSNSNTTNSISGLTPGVYTVTVTDPTPDSEIQSFTITEPSSISVSSVTADVDCNGNATGGIDISVAGGTSTYSYIWPGGATTEDISGVSAGTYELTVTDNNGCIHTENITITEPAVLSVTTASCTDLSAVGLSDGSSSLNVTGGTTAYTYLWSNGDMTSSIAGLPAGTYTATVTDANGCTGTASCTVNSISCSVTASVSVTNVTCNGTSDGTATGTMTGGLGTSFTYIWSNGQSSQTAIGLSGGTQSVTITDNTGCSAAASQNLTEPSALTVTTSPTNASCFGNSDGSINLTVSGGTLGYGFNWSNGSTNEDPTNLVAGTYNVTVLDGSGCPAVDSETISEPADITLTVNTVDASCGNADGSATANGTGGSGAGYGYLWSNGETTPSIGSISAGSFTVTVTDGSGCSKSGNALISNIGGPTVTITNVIDILCNGDDSGSAEAQVSGGTPGYTYLWDNGETSSTATALPVALSTVTVTDSAIPACSAISSVSIQEPAKLIPTVVSSVGVSCGGNSDANAIVSATGGIIPYTYAWDSGATTDTITGLSAGTYNVTVIDANSCVSSGAITITDPSPVAVSISAPTSACSGTNASLSGNATGGTGPYNYSWSNGDNTNPVNITINSDTTIMVTATDNNGCTATGNVTVQVSSGSDPTILSTGPYCTATGPFNLSAGSSGGVWGGQGITNQLDGTFDPSTLSPGIYQVTYITTGTCSGSDAADLEVYQAHSVSGIVTDESCPGNNDGAVDVSISGSKTPYTYVWSNGESTEDISGLAPDLYTVEITDSSNCTVDTTYTVVETSADCIDPHVFIPNIFSPDGDNMNDILFVRGEGIREFTFSIYDRWGEKVFETSDQSIGWDGTFRGKELTTAVFVYYINGSFDDFEDFQENGNITLIR